MERPCILIIDDDPNLRKTLADILRVKGYGTLTVEDGEKGLAGADLASAGVVAERLRMVVQAETDVTISLGVASFTADMPDMETLIGKADKALYRAKERGRNRVEGCYGLIPVFEDQARRVL